MNEAQQKLVEYINSLKQFDQFDEEDIEYGGYYACRNKKNQSIDKSLYYETDKLFFTKDTYFVYKGYYYEFCVSSFGDNFGERTLLEDHYE